MFAKFRWKRFHCKLKPLHEVTVNGQTTYISEGNDPQFSVLPDCGVLPSGRCLLRLRGAAEHGALNPVIYLDDGSGFRETLKVELPGRGPGITSEVFFTLPEGIKAIRFDPLSRPGQFTIDDFQIIAVGKYAKAAKLIVPHVGRALKNPAWGKTATLNALRIYRRDGLTGLKGAILRKHTERRSEYSSWIECFDTLSDFSRARMREQIQKWQEPPCISILLPVFNPPPALLEEAIMSVRKQIYPHWELCIADDASTDPRIRRLLQDHAAQDARIKVRFREVNGHISAASNSALELATGSFIALLDHDDLLAEHALYWVAEAILRIPDVGLIYSDEDKIDVAGNRHDPYFKCDWNLPLFRSQNMISHLGVYRASLLREIGGFRMGFEGSQDYDLALRCIEKLPAEQIHHIPRILYHWRVIPGSTAMNGAEKPYAVVAGERALQEHLQRTGVGGNVEATPHGHYRVRYPLPESPPLVSLIIPTRNGLQLLRQCIASIRAKTTYRHYEIIVIDNGSDDPETLAYLDALRQQAGALVIRDDRPFNYSALNNAAVSVARGELICLLNNDVEVISPDWLSEMTSLAVQPNVGAVGACLWYPHDTLQHGGVIIGLLGVAGHAQKHLPKGRPGYFGRAILPQSYSAVTAACLLVRKSIYLAVGGLNEKDLTVAFNDVDFCLKLLEHGYQNIWTPYAELYHHESVSRGHENTPEKQARFQREIEYMQSTWKHRMSRDPAYSPNLSLDRDDFSLAWPPRHAPMS